MMNCGRYLNLEKYCLYINILLHGRSLLTIKQLFSIIEFILTGTLPLFLKGRRRNRAVGDGGTGEAAHRNTSIIL